MQAPSVRTGRIEQIQAVLGAFLKFYSPEGYYSQTAGDPQVCDFAFGNPHELPLPGITTALQRWAEPQTADWFAYKQSERPAREAVAESLQRLYGAPFEAEHIHMTSGAFSGLAACLTALVNPGDEVIFVSPPWFFYEPLILNTGAQPVRVKIDAETFDLDLEAIATAITPRTRVIIINSPNNPTGRIYPAETLQALAGILDDASRENGRPIYLLSDEAYSRILYDGRKFVPPFQFYSNTLIIYTYGKTLLMPGERIGYIALPPELPNRETVEDALMVAQILTGWAYPNAILQYALPELETMSIDLDRLQAKRDRMVMALRDMGYELHKPEGTFYLLVKSPIADDQAFCERLAQEKILCLPGAIVEMPGYFRISLTANEEMIERALPGFEKVMRG